MMATYNGEKYLQQQLDSIINQTYKNWSLIIQDDGSTDSTWSILEKYTREDHRITIRKSPEFNHGPYYNFHSIANQEKQNDETYDYYMFCDQDDVWNENKIEKMVSRIKQEKEEVPVFVYADMCVVNEYGDVIIPSICMAQGLSYINKESLFFSHNIYGCNTIMNKAAFFAIPVIDITQNWVSILSHDNLYAKFSGMLGMVVFYPEKVMSYRRHGDNVTSKHSYGFEISRVLRRVIGLQDLAKDHARTYKQSLTAIKLLKETQLKSDDMNISNELDEIEKAIENGGIPALSWIKKRHIGWGNGTKDISHKLILGLGIYKKYLTY